MQRVSMKGNEKIIFVFCYNLPAQNKTMGTSQFYFNASLVVITAELTTFTVTATAGLQK